MNQPQSPNSASIGSTSMLHSECAIHVSGFPRHIAFNRSQSAGLTSVIVNALRAKNNKFLATSIVHCAFVEDSRCAYVEFSSVSEAKEFLMLEGGINMYKSRLHLEPWDYDNSQSDAQPDQTTPFSRGAKTRDVPMKPGAKRMRWHYEDRTRPSAASVAEALRDHPQSSTCAGRRQKTLYAKLHPESLRAGDRPPPPTLIQKLINQECKSIDWKISTPEESSPTDFILGCTGIADGRYLIHCITEEVTKKLASIGKFRFTLSASAKRKHWHH